MHSPFLQSIPALWLTAHFALLPHLKQTQPVILQQSKTELFLHAMNDSQGRNIHTVDTIHPYSGVLQVPEKSSPDTFSLSQVFHKTDAFFLHFLSVQVLPHVSPVCWLPQSDITFLLLWSKRRKAPSVLLPDFQAESGAERLSLITSVLLFCVLYQSSLHRFLNPDESQVTPWHPAD